MTLSDANMLTTVDHAPDVWVATVWGLPVPVVMTRRSDRRITAVNAAACDFLGRSQQELVSLTVDEITAPADRAEVDRQYASASRTGLILDKQYVRGDGTLVPGQVHAITLDDSDFAIAAIVDTSEFVAHSRRLDVLRTISSLMSDRQAEDTDQLARAIEATLAEHLDIEANIEWYDVDTPDRTLAGDSTGGFVQPIRADGQVLGTLTVPDAAGPSRPDRDFLTVVAAYAGAAHTMQRVHDELQAAAMFEAGFVSTRVGMQVVSPCGTFLRVNDAFARMVGRSADELVGSNWRDITDPRDHRSDDTIPSAIADERAPIWEGLKRYVRPDGSVVWATVSVVALAGCGRHGADQPVHISHVVDVTPQIEAIESERAVRRELEVSEQRYRSLVEPARELILRVDLDGRIEDVNARVEAALGRDRSEIVSRPIERLLPEHLSELVSRHLAEVEATARPSEHLRTWIEPAHGPAGWFSLRFVPEVSEPDGAVEHVHIVAHDVTELVENERRLAAMALADPLTGLSNRAAVFGRLQHAVDRLRRRSEAGIAVAVLDLDHFKAINDTYGHAAGDSALTAVAAALRSVVRAEDTVGRLGGDEFIIVFEDVADRADADELGDCVVDVLRATAITVADGRRYRMSASVGVAFVDEPAEINDIVARADAAMYQAKRHGRGRAWIERSTSDLGASTPSSSAILRELAAALDRHQFELHYQPIARAVDDRIVAYEALLRWRHPDHGLLGPNRFLDLLMSTGQIGPVGQWVLRAAVRQLATWQEDPSTADVRLHVNVSPAELTYPGLAATLRDVIDADRVDPSRLRIEVTEQAFVDTVVSTSTLAEVASTGVDFVLDDFGTGVSSLAHLRTPFLRGIKIDRSFIANALHDDRERAITESVISLADALGIEVTAEGVEDQDQAEWLRDAGCHQLQGWHIGRPKPHSPAPSAA